MRDLWFPCVLSFLIFMGGICPVSEADSISKINPKQLAEKASNFIKQPEALISVIATTGGSLIVLTGITMDAPEVIPMGAFIGAAGCAKAFSVARNFKKSAK